MQEQNQIELHQEIQQFLATRQADERNKVFKNCSSFTSFKNKINNTVNNAKDNNR